MHASVGISLTTLLLSCAVAFAEVSVLVDRNPNENNDAAFKFERVPAPSRNDAAAAARFVLVAGERDPNGGDLEKLHDGKLPSEEDEPAENFFFKAGSDGGRLLIDLGSAIKLKQINTYSWHPGTRGPQVYQVYASDGLGTNTEPQTGVDPAQRSWRLVAKVDTRPAKDEPGGQYGVSISDSSGSLGRYRFLLFDIAPTEKADPFGNTFFSEIDVVDAEAQAAPEPISTAAVQLISKTFEAGSGAYQITIDTSAAPDLTDWAYKELAPAVVEWYPKLVQMLPSTGFEAARHISIVFKPGMAGIPAATGGARITCNAQWFRENLQGEARGSVVHEMVHVVQHYGRPNRANPNGVQRPGWLVEGIADYIRWFRFERESHGAEITTRNLSRARYNASYRITANFLNWVSETYDHDLVQHLNTALREGTYGQEIWAQRTGHSVQELGEEWRAAVEKKTAANAPQ